MITNIYFECTRDELNVLKTILNEVKDIEWASAYDIDEFGLCCGHFDIAYDEDRFIKKEQSND